MTQPEYEQKKRECYQEYLDYTSEKDTPRISFLFTSAFDRAYALGKQEKDADAKPNATMKARRKSDGEIIEVKEWRGVSDVIYSSPDMNRFYQASDLDFNLDADTVIQGWVARDWNGDLWMFKHEPYRSGHEWYGDLAIEAELGRTIFRSLTWDDAPCECEIIIKRKKK